MEGLATPFQGIAQGIVNLGKHFSNVLNYLNPLSEDFILKNVLSGIGGILDYINPFSENFILKSVINGIGNILSYINPFSENFFGYKIVEFFKNLFIELFVPQQDQFTEFSNNIKSKFGFVDQIKELVQNLFSFDNSPYSVSTQSEDTMSNYPKWEIEYYGTKVSIIDFEAFDRYRGVVHGIIIAVMYISFIFRLYRKLPGLVGGFTIY